MNLKETTMSSETAWSGRVFRVDRHQVRLGDGGESVRDIVRHAGGVGVLARTPRNTFLLVRQYRKAVDREVLEIVAGMRDSGEAPADTARRELEEETGYRATSIEALGRVFPSPGYTDEVIHVYFAETEAEPGADKMDSDERVQVVELGRDELERRIRDNELHDAKTIAAWYYARERGRV